MTLPANIVTAAATEYGVPLGCYVADPTLDVEWQRASSSGGAPVLASAETIAVVPGTEAVFLDVLPNDGATRWYRCRHTFPGDEPSPWTCWRSAAPVRLTGRYELPPPAPLVVREQPSETATAATLTLAIEDPQCRLTRVEFRTQAGTAAPSAWAEDATAPYATSVALVEKQVSRIAYRVTGYDGDGRERVLFEEVVPYAAGAVPLPPTVSAEIDASGNLIIELTGDSDTAGFRVAYGTGAVPTDSQVRVGPYLSGRVVRVTYPTAYAATTVAFVGVFAYSASGLESARVTVTATRGGSGSDVVVREQPSESGLTGTLHLAITDPLSRVQTVEGRTKSGALAWSGWSVLSPSLYSQSVALVEKQISLVQYRVTGTLQTGGSGVLAEGTVPFTAGAVPLPPQPELDVSSTGVVSLRVVGDSDTRSYRLAFALSPASPPSDAAALSGTVYDQGGRVLSVPSLTTLNLGQTLHLKIVAFSGASGTGLASTPTTLEFTRQGVAATKTVRLMAAEATVANSLTMGYVTPNNGGYIQRQNPAPNGGNSTAIFLRVPLKLPRGVTVTVATPRVYLDWSASGGAVSVFFQRGETGVVLGQLTTFALIGWQLLGPIFLNESVGSEDYYFIVTLTPGSSSASADGWARFHCIDVTYLSPTEANTL